MKEELIEELEATQEKIDREDYDDKTELKKFEATVNRLPKAINKIETYQYSVSIGQKIAVKIKSVSTIIAKF